MGTRGPVPKRTEERRRRNKVDPGSAVAEAPAAPIATCAPAAEDWHPIAASWYGSLAESGQSRFYEPSDWATAYLVAESMSRDLNPQFVGFAQTGRDETEAEFAVIPLKGASLAAYLKAMGNLLVTEGDRRRASIELKRGTATDPDEDAAVASLDAYRARLS
jgi:hypothetical protein